jgi:hypothetical protein
MPQKGEVSSGVHISLRIPDDSWSTHPGLEPLGKDEKANEGRLREVATAGWSECDEALGGGSRASPAATASVTTAAKGPLRSC